MIILAKITTFFILILVVTYGVIFYSPAIQKLNPLQSTTVTTTETITPTEAPVTNTEDPILPTTTKTTVQPAAQPTNSVPSPAAEAKCIITVDNTKYDVTQYRTIHSGGDIFKCGTDMTTIFYKRHSAKLLQQMSQYKI
ncbi:MAG: hypothetical protein PHQ59_03975 [Candidatus Daviesbacteria bacterium]|nr:hypothetical protein [Candidatus Daviesbacteria bacterium]